MALSPTAEGFRVTFRQPLLTLGEITWRWVVGATATALFLFGLLEYLKTLPVSNGELLFLRSRQPYLVAQAIAHILRGSLSRAVLSVILAALALTLLWMIAASAGRIATVGELLHYFRGQHIAGDAASAGRRDVATSAAANGVSASFPALVRLNFLRTSLALAAVLGFFGAATVAGMASPAAHPRPGLMFFLFLPMAGLICVLWCGLNWLLSLAGMFAVRDGQDAIGAIFSAVTLCRERTGAVAAVSTWTGLAHVVAFVGATTVISMGLGFAPIIPGRLVVVPMMLVTLSYFALADWLYMARLAGYVCITETPEVLLRPQLPPAMPTPPPTVMQVQSPSLQTTIDRDEPILSDVPSPANG